MQVSQTPARGGLARGFFEKKNTTNISQAREQKKKNAATFPWLFAIKKCGMLNRSLDEGQSIGNSTVATVFVPGSLSRESLPPWLVTNWRA